MEFTCQWFPINYFITRLSAEFRGPFTFYTLCLDKLDSLEEAIKHAFVDLLGSGAVEFEHIFVVRTVGVESAELAPCVAEQDQEMLGLRAGNLLEHAAFGFLVYHTREDAVLNSVEHDATIAFSRRLLVQFWPVVIHHGARVRTDITGSIIEHAPLADQPWRQRSRTCQNYNLDWLNDARTIIGPIRSLSLPCPEDVLINPPCIICRIYSSKTHH